MRRARWVLASGVLAVAVLVGVATVALTAVDPGRAYAPGVTVAVAPLEIGCAGRTISIPARWSFPAGEPTALAWVQHGFARSGPRMADLADRLAADGLLVVAPTIDAFGDCSLGSADGVVPGIAAALAQGTDASLVASARAAGAEAGIAVSAIPEEIVLAGHSAGGAAMTGVAAELVAAGADAALRIVLLLDPVESRAGIMAASLPSLADLELLLVAGPPGPCNAGGSGPAAAARERAEFHGVRLTSGCHCDPEGASTNLACTLPCGASSAENVAILQRLASAWVGAALGGTSDAAFRPGGTELQRLVDEGTVTLLGG